VAQSTETQLNFISLKGNSDLVTPAPTGDKRFFVKLQNYATSWNSVAGIEFLSGSLPSGTSLVHHAREYSFPNANGPFTGFGQIYSRDNGLILRTGSPENPFGVIKFMTATNTIPVGFAERIRISADGNMGLGTENPKSKIQVTDGDVYIDNPNRGIIMKDVNGGCWRITLGVVGNFVSTPIVCP
jgi:hypothetical protein